MSEYHYGWRDIGLGPIRTEPTIRGVFGNFDFMKEEQQKYEEPKGCEFCGIVLTYSDKIKKSFCTKCGHPLTEEDRRILSTPGASVVPTIDKERVLPNNEIEIDDIGGTGSMIRKNEEGFTPMKRGANSDSVSRREQTEGIGSGYIKALPSSSRDKKRNNPNLYRTPSGDLIPLDSDRRKMIDEGKIIISAKDEIPEGTGPNHAEVVSSDELRRRKEENARYDGRYEGRSESYPEDPDNYSNSGLKV
jgi:hypothetical protein